MNHPRPPNLDNPSAGEERIAGAAPESVDPALAPDDAVEPSVRKELPAARAEPMEPDQAQEALIEIQELLRRARLVETVVHNQVMDKH